MEDKIFLGDSRLHIIVEIRRCVLGYESTDALDSLEDYLENKGYISVKQYDLLKQIYKEVRKVDIPEYLDNLEGVDDSLKDKIARDYLDNPERLKNACKVVKATKDVEDPCRLLKAALKNRWKPEESKDDIIERNQIWKRHKLAPLDGHNIGPYRMQVYNLAVEFCAGGATQPKVFNVENKSFVKLVIDFITSIKSSCCV